MIESKLPNVGTTIFTVMSKMATDFGAINLSQGYPDFDVSQELIEKVSGAMIDGYNQYAPMPGLPILREAIAESLKVTYQWEGNQDTEITVTGGATEALYSCITAFIHAGDEAIVLEPAYDSYIPAIQLSGGIPVTVSLDPEDFAVPWEDVKEAITPRTRMILINSPHNPTGSILAFEDLIELEKIAIENELLVLSDEVYDRIIFDETIHQSVLRFAELRKRSMAVFSFGKTFHVTGWKIGYVVAPDTLTKEIRRIHQFLNFSVNTPMQHGIALYLENKDNYLGLHKFYEKKRDLFLEYTANSRFMPVPCSGTYFQLMSYAGTSDLNEYDMAVHMTQQHKVACIPVSVFYTDQRNNNLLRFCFAKKDETLEKAADILCQI